MSFHLIWSADHREWIGHLGWRLASAVDDWLFHLATLPEADELARERTCLPATENAALLVTHIVWAGEAVWCRVLHLHLDRNANTVPIGAWWQPPVPPPAVLMAHAKRRDGELDPMT